MREYSIPDIFIRTFEALYHHSGRYSSWFEVKSGVRQECVLSGFNLIVLVVLIMDWVMRHINDRRRGLRWIFTSVLDDLDYADDVALMSSRFADLQEKTERLAATADIVGLKINPRKTKTLRMNHGLHQDGGRGGGRFGILRAPRVSSRSRHQEATSTSENRSHQTSEHLEVRKTQSEDQVVHPEFECPVRAVVWSGKADSN